MADSVDSSRNPSIRKRPARRRPTMFTEWQLEILVAKFKADQYPDIYARERLATSLQLEEGRIHIWFQNRRARERRAALKIASTSPTTRDHGDGYHHALPSIVDVGRKRNSPCDRDDDVENTPPLSKKPAGVSPSMSVDFLSRSSSRSSGSASSFYRRWTDDAMGLPRTTPRDTHRGAAATSPLMSVDFLSRSSSSPSPSPSRLTPGISPAALTARSSPSSCYAWPGHPYIFMVPY